MSTNVIIDVRDLRKSYGQTRAVDGLSFSVQPSEIFGMLGPNGAGKTTTVECIEGLREPDSGSIEVLGMSQAQGKDRNKIKARIGVQLQTTGLYPKLTVRELLSLFASFYTRPLSVDELVDLVGLSEKEGSRSKDLSGGQRQRLSLGLALVGNPDIVFLDEPTTGLDPQARRAVWDVILDLKRRGKAVVLTTHYMEEAELLCDRVAVVDHGRIIELDRPAALIARHFQDSAIEFAASQGWTSERLAQLPGVSNSLLDDDHIVLYSNDVPRTLAGLFAIATQLGLTTAEMAVRSATLEDVFLKLTGRRIRE